MLYKQSLASWVTFMSAVIPALPRMLQVSIFKKAISIPRILAGWNVTTLTFSGLSLSQLLSVFWLYDTNMLQMLFSISGNTHGILNENMFFFSLKVCLSLQPLMETWVALRVFMEKIALENRMVCYYSKIDFSYDKSVCHYICHSGCIFIYTCKLVILGQNKLECEPNFVNSKMYLTTRDCACSLWRSSWTSPMFFYIAGGHDIVSIRGELVGGSDGGGSVVYVDGGLEVTTRLKCQWQKGRGKNRVEWCWQAIQISGAVYKNGGWWARFNLKLADCHFSCVKKILYVVDFFKFMPGLFSPFQDLLVCREMEQGPRVKH